MRGHASEIRRGTRRNRRRFRFEGFGGHRRACCDRLHVARQQEGSKAWTCVTPGPEGAA